MSVVVVVQWNFSPPGYFEEPIEIVRGDYTLTIANGKAEATLESAAYDANPSIRQTLHEGLNDRFLGVQAADSPRIRANALHYDAGAPRCSKGHFRGSGASAYRLHLPSRGCPGPRQGWKYHRGLEARTVPRRREALPT